MLLRVSIPFNAANEYVREFKQAHRRDDDIAIVNAGMRARMAEAVTGAFSTLSSNVRCMSACQVHDQFLVSVEFLQLFMTGG